MGWTTKHGGPCTNDVPPCQQFGPISSTKIKQPPLPHQILADPLPSPSRRHLCLPPKRKIVRPTKTDNGRLSERASGCQWQRSERAGGRTKWKSSIPHERESEALAIFKGSCGIEMNVPETSLVATTTPWLYSLYS